MTSKKPLKLPAAAVRFAWMGLAAALVSILTFNMSGLAAAAPAPLDSATSFAAVSSKKTATVDCEDGQRVQNKKCVDKCSKSYREEGKKRCVKKCSKGYLEKNTKTKRQCVKSCGKSYKKKDNRCVKKTKSKKKSESSDSKPDSSSKDDDDDDDDDKKDSKNKQAETKKTPATGTGTNLKTGDNDCTNTNYRDDRGFECSTVPKDQAFCNERGGHAVKDGSGAPKCVKAGAGCTDGSKELLADKSLGACLKPSAGKPKEKNGAGKGGVCGAATGAGEGTDASGFSCGLPATPDISQRRTDCNYNPPAPAHLVSINGGPMCVYDDNKALCPAAGTYIDAMKAPKKSPCQRS